MLVYRNVCHQISAVTNAASKKGRLLDPCKESQLRPDYIMLRRVP